MLMTQLKPMDAIAPLVRGKVFLLCCHGCREIGFPEQDADTLCRQLSENHALVGALTADALCSPANLQLHLRGCMAEIGRADTVLVLSCGVGVQTVADLLEDRRVCAGCDTIALPGFQGVTPLEYDCKQCAECFLTLTGGICPITACSKSLRNGPCGGAKRGKCEVCPEMDCGWERIFQRLKAQGRLGLLHCGVQLHDFSTEEATR